MLLIAYTCRRREPNLSFFGRTDLRISLSSAKFDGEADFEVRLAVAPQKTSQNDEKRKFFGPNFRRFFFRRRKIKRRESSETRFGKVSRQSKPISSPTGVGDG